ncbi:hypothetical protein MCEMRE196_00945 [Candidatus Nanopelagicaceae bacterium]
MKRAVSLKHKHSIRFLILGALLLSGMNSANAAVLFDSDNGSCSSYGSGPTRVTDIPITIAGAATVSSIVLQIGSPFGENSSQIRIYSDNSGIPGSLLGTLPYSSASGNFVTYTGTISLSTVGKYWFRFSSTSYYAPCYNLSPSLTGSLAGWSLGRVRESGDSAANFTTRSDDLAFLFTINGSGGTAPVNSSVTVSANSLATFRQALTLTASLGVAGSDGKVTFYADGKKIPGCINKSSVSLSATCSWKPSKRGSSAITARVVPTDGSFIASTSVAKNILVSNRSNKR